MELDSILILCFYAVFRKDIFDRRGWEMRTFLIAAASVAAVGAIVPAGAATVGDLQGEVLVNEGNGFQSLKGPAYANVKPGSQIMVRPGGSALITYASNCSVRVPSGVWAVQSTPPCETGTSVIDFTTRMNQAAPPPGGADPTTPLLIGGALVAAGVGAAIALSQTGGPSSP